MRDQLDKQIHRDQNTEWRQEHSVMAEGEGGTRMRRHPIEVRAGNGFGPLEQVPANAPNSMIVPGICSGGDFWRRSAQADKNEGKISWERAEDRSTRGAATRKNSCILQRKTLTILALLLATVVGRGCAAEAQALDCAVSHPMGDAWWTGPMLANTAATAPRGHFLIEPYLFDVTTQGSFDRQGVRHSTAPANGYGSLTYMVFGVTDKWNVGLIPTFSYNTGGGEPSSADPGVGDLTLQVQHRLTQFEPCRWVPTISAVVQETLPTGRYDRLGNRPADGVGAGAYATNLEFLSQMYFWIPNRRIVRMRLNVTDAISSNAHVDGVSVYGTGAGFSGHARPGSSFLVDVAWEYSVTRNWVFALDATYRNTRNTRVTGYGSESGSPMTPLAMDSGVSDAYGFAPAFEYSWKPNIGVLLGVRLIPAGRNTNETITPAVAVNFVR